MNGSYAKKTSVPVERTRAEIEQTLLKYKADCFAYATEPGKATIGFRVKDADGTVLAIRMTLPLQMKVSSQARFEQECRSRWRAMLLTIKAKLEACAIGISTIEREFLADVVTPTGQTIGDMLRPQLAGMSNGEVPRLMLTA